LLILLISPLSAESGSSLSGNLLYEAPSLYGLSGFVYNPSPWAIPERSYSLSIHNYLVKFGYAPFRGAEASLLFNSDEVNKLNSETVKEFDFGFKYALAAEPDSRFSSCMILRQEGGRGNVLAFSGGKFLKDMGEIYAGLGFKIFKESDYHVRNVLTLSGNIYQGLAFLDYDETWSLGFRFFFSRFTPNLKFDIFFTSLGSGKNVIDNLYVGLSWNER